MPRVSSKLSVGGILSCPVKHLRPTEVFQARFINNYKTLSLHGLKIVGQGTRNEKNVAKCIILLEHVDFPDVEIWAYAVASMKLTNAGPPPYFSFSAANAAPGTFVFAFFRKLMILCFLGLFPLEKLCRKALIVFILLICTIHFISNF